MKKIIIISTITLIIDQIIKILVDTLIPLNQSINIIPDFFNLTYVQNTGAAFSLFMGFRYILIIVSLSAVYLIYKYFIKNKRLKNSEIIIYSLLLSGIIGNMVDRIIHGYVIDYLDFNIFGYNFAIFNLADSLIVISMGILLINTLKEELCKNT